MPEIKTLSQSSVNMLIRCGERWRRCYLMGQRIPPTDAMVRGLAVDAAVEWCLRDDRSDDHEGYIAAIMNKHDTDWGQVATPTMAEADSCDLACQIGENWLDKHRWLISHVRPIEVQAWVRLEVPGVPLPVVGRADIVLPDMVIDVKTEAEPLANHDQ